MAPVVTWTDLDDLIATINAGEFGLAAYVYAGDTKDALKIAERLEAGMVGVNRGLVFGPICAVWWRRAEWPGRE